MAPKLESTAGKARADLKDAPRTATPNGHEGMATKGGTANARLLRRARGFKFATMIQASDLTSITNIGPATAKALIGAGVPDVATLRALGAHEAYRALVLAGEKPHFIGYYVLQMALQGRPWNDCRGAEKAALRERFDALIADCRRSALPDDIPHSLAEALDRIGLARR